MTQYFSAEMIGEVSAEDIGEYPLPFKSEIIVRVKSVSMARMKQYQESVQKGGSVATSAGKDLIRESIVDENGKPVYTRDTAEQMLKGRTRLVAAFLQMISHHNGGDDKVQEEAEKKSDLAE